MQSGLQHTSLILDIHVTVNWHLSKQGNCWPVLHDHIVGSSFFLVDCCPAFDWIIGWNQVNFITVIRSLLSGLAKYMHYSRNRKHELCFYRVIETWVEVWENEKCCGNMSHSECFHSFCEFSQTSTSVSITLWKHGEHVFYFFY